jgi:hypothetical protein
VPLELDEEEGPAPLVLAPDELALLLDEAAGPSPPVPTPDEPAWELEVVVVGPLLPVECDALLHAALARTPASALHGSATLAVLATVP